MYWIILKIIDMVAFVMVVNVKLSDPIAINTARPQIPPFPFKRLVWKFLSIFC